MFLNPSEEEKQLLQKTAKEFEDKFYALTHELFKNNPKGQEWLSVVTEAFLINTRIADPRYDEKLAFFNEGIASFVRNINQIIKVTEMRAKKGQKKEV